MALERLQKIIAAAGIASRRKAEELIQSGVVAVNGKTVTELGSKADPETDSIRVNDKLLKGAERHEYIALNKPKGYVTTVSDPEGRPTVMELVRSKARLYPIGRLDFNSEGLLLLTNDGDLAYKLMKAASHIPKTYLVKVSGQPGEDQLRSLRAGVSIQEERDPSRRVRTARAQIRVIKEAENPWLEVTLHEGRNRQIRKMFEEVGHHVEKIRRVRYGPLELDLPPGESRVLTPQEVRRLQQAIEAPAKPFNTEASAGRDVRRPRSDTRRPSFRDQDGRDRRPPTRDRSEQRPRFSDRPRPGLSERPRFGGRPETGKRDDRPPSFAARRPREDGERPSSTSFKSRGEGRGERKPPFRARPQSGERGGPKTFSGAPRRDERTDRSPRPPRFAGRSDATREQGSPVFPNRERPRKENSDRPPNFENRRGGQRPGVEGRAERRTPPSRGKQGFRFSPRGPSASKSRPSNRARPSGKNRPPARGNRDRRS